MPVARPLSPALYARIGPLLDQALELAPADRLAWLATLDDESPDVLATLIQLMGQADGANEFLPSGPGRYSLSEIMSERSATSAGARIGAWTLESVLGAGGMGTVWLAHRSDGSYTGRAAIKLLHLSHINQLEFARFRQEGTLLATLAHPNIAPLLDAGLTDAGQPYLVMEYVEGIALDEYAAQHALGTPARIALVQQVLDAISHAHARLIVHRDLKPSNILVRDDGRVALLDFGIAKQLTMGQLSDTDAVTAVESRALTPLYASPEQLRGDAIGTASDIYSAGVVAYTLLAGVHPTAGEARSTAEILRTTCEVEPQRTNLGELDSILRKALQKLPDERYETAAAFNDDLHRHLAHKPVRACPDSLGYRVSRFTRRHRLGVAGATAAMLAVMVTAGVAVRQAQRAAQARDRAVFQSERAETTRQFQTVLLSQIGTEPLDLRQLLDKGVQMFEAGRPPDPRITATLLMSFAERYAELKLHGVEGRLLWRADSAARASGDPITRRATTCALALHFAVAENRGSVDSAATQLRQSDALASRLTGPIDPLDDVTCLEARARLLTNARQPDSALTLTRRIIQILENAGRVNTLQMIAARSTMAGLFGSLNRSRLAVAEHERQLEALSQMGLAGSLTSTVILSNLATERNTLGERAAVLPLRREVNRRLAAADSVGGFNPVSAFNLASDLFADEQVDSALVWFRASAASARIRQLPVVEGRALLGIVRSLAALDRSPEAALIADQYLTLVRGLKGPVDRDSLIVTSFVAAGAHDTAAAIARLEHALEMDGVLRSPPRNRKSWTALRTITPLLLGQGATDRAATYARLMRGIADIDSLTATRSADVGLADLYLARAFAAGGLRDSARVRARAARVALGAGAGQAHAQTRAAADLIAALR